MQKQFDYDDAVVNYTDEGTGNPIVLIHGFAEDASVWQAQTAFLSKGYRVIVPDLPGSGQSEYNAALVSIDDFAEVVRAVLLHENIERSILLGHSMGGHITLAFADKHSQYLSAFGLVHSTAFADSDEKKQNRAKGIKLMDERGAYAFIKSATPNLFATHYKNTYPEKVEQLVEKGRDFKKEALQQYYRAMMARPDRTDVLTNSRVPVLFVVGAEDAAVPLSDSLKQVHLPSTAHICLLEHCGHMGMWEETEKTNECIAAFAGTVH